MLVYLLRYNKIVLVFKNEKEDIIDIVYIMLVIICQN